MNSLPIFSNKALCAESDPDAWFDYKVSGGRVLERLETVKSICRQCPAQLECLDYAMQYTGLFGVWGGLDHIERERLQRKNNLPTVDLISTLSPPVIKNKEGE